MAEEGLEANVEGPELGDEDLTPVVEEPVVDEPDGLTDLEREQMKHGWKPKDQLDNPDDYVSAERYKKTGELITKANTLESKLKTVEKDFSQRLENATMFVTAQNVLLKEQLNKQRREMIKEGDVEGVEAIDKQIATIPDESKPEVKDDKTEKALLLEWNENNPWIFDSSSAKAKFATNSYNVAVNVKGLSAAEAIAYVDEKLADKFPDKPVDVNQRRNEPGLGDAGGKPKGGGSNKKTIPKSQWTHEEASVAQSLEQQGYTEAEINQMVIDSRSMT